MLEMIGRKIILKDILAFSVDVLKREFSVRVGRYDFIFPLSQRRVRRLLALLESYGVKGAECLVYPGIGNEVHVSGMEGDVFLEVPEYKVVEVLGYRVLGNDVEISHCKRFRVEYSPFLLFQTFYCPEEDEEGVEG